jgi:hypothetical protein
MENKLDKNKNKIKKELIVRDEGQADKGLNEVISHQNPCGGLQYDDWN